MRVLSAVAVIVADDWQHHGGAAHLLNTLAGRARDVGITRFRAGMLTENTAARHLFSTLGPVLASTVGGGHTVLTLDTAGEPEAN